MNRNHTPIQPAAAGCLHPSCQAHNAHQTAQHAAGLTHNHAPANQPYAPAEPRRRFKISKNWVIGILIVLLVGAAGSLSDKDNEINNLKAKVSHSATTTTKTDSTAKLDYIIKLCHQIAAKGDYAQCVTETLAQGQH
jgi:hypothetical protein